MGLKERGCVGQDWYELDEEIGSSGGIC